MKSVAPVSVVIPCYKVAATIGRAVDSIYQQTQRPAEVLLVDDCSPDNTLVTLKDLQQRYGKEWLKIIELPRNVGAGFARNAGWDNASQKYIAFLDADDSWHPQKIEQQIKWMEQNSRAILSSHARKEILEQATGKIIAQNEMFTCHKVDKRLLLRNLVVTSSVVLVRDIPLRFPSKRYSEDYQLWLDILFSYEESYISELPLVFAYKAPYGESGLSGNLWKMERGELLTYRWLYKQKRISFVECFLYQSISLVKYVRRVIKKFLLL